jgi:hypothetical protein
MRILMKPYKQEEYDRYFSMATNRTPIVKERRTRHSVVYYPWKHELGKSYFDSHPGMLLYRTHCIFSVIFCSLAFGFVLFLLYSFCRIFIMLITTPPC